MAFASPDFEKLNLIYSAIRDIDKIRASKSEDKFDEIMNVIKDIKKQEFDEENTEKVIMGIRNALVKIYVNSLGNLNNTIALQSQFKDKAEIVYREDPEERVFTGTVIMNDDVSKIEQAIPAEIPEKLFTTQGDSAINYNI